MRRANVLVHGILAGTLEDDAGRWVFAYLEGYRGPPVSLTLPLGAGPFSFERLPAFFDGLLPEGILLEGLLAARKLDRSDHFGQLVAVGQDLVGAVTLEEVG